MIESESTTEENELITKHNYNMVEIAYSKNRNQVLDDVKMIHVGEIDGHIGINDEGQTYVFYVPIVIKCSDEDDIPPKINLDAVIGFIIHIDNDNDKITGVETADSFFDDYGLEVGLHEMYPDLHSTLTDRIRTSDFTIARIFNSETGKVGYNAFTNND